MTVKEFIRLLETCDERTQVSLRLNDVTYEIGTPTIRRLYDQGRIQIDFEHIEGYWQ